MKSTLLIKLEKISSDWVLADSGDLQVLAALHAELTGIVGECEENVREAVSRHCNVAIGSLEKLIMGESQDPTQELHSISSSISGLYSVVSDGLPQRKGSAPPRSKKAVPKNEKSANMAVDENILRDFLGRQPGVLENLEERILAMEKLPDTKTLEDIQRILHTLKGESALLGMSEVEKLCHKAEDFLEAAFTSGRAEGLLQIKDWLERRFLSLEGKGEAPPSVDGLMATLSLPQNLEASKAEFQETPELDEGCSQNDPALLTEFFHESQDHLEAADICLMRLETEPGDGESLNAVFRAFHTIKGVAGFLGFRNIQSFAHETENLLDKVRMGKVALNGNILDLVFEAVDSLKKRLKWLAEQPGKAYPKANCEAMNNLLRKIKGVTKSEFAGMPSATLPSAKAGMKLGEILVASGALPQASLGEALEHQHADGTNAPLGELLVKDAGVPAHEVALALRSQKAANEQTASLVKETVKVEAERLDRLLDAIGELVIAESMIFQSPELKGRKSPVLTQQMVLLDKITRELQKMGTSLRMVPVRPVFQKMARLVRDVSRKNGKQVEFVCSGDETELDKTVVDKIGDPLVHMVRNSVDHGIETQIEDRIKAGKPAMAKVGLRAFQKGGNVCIEVYDDGRGLNRAAIVKKARERGLIENEGETLTDGEVWNFIFDAGFSTAAEVTEISGRGVGMDVVKRSIEELHGRIEIESQPGVGTTFSIWLPLSLAITDGMIMRLGREKFVFPTLSILRIVPLVEAEIFTVEGRAQMLNLQGEIIPLLSMEGLFPRFPTDDNNSPRLAVIVESKGRKAGLPVDELLGQQQVVIKGLGESFKHIPGLTGGAILSDGTVGVILEVDELLQSLRTEKLAA